MKSVLAPAAVPVLALALGLTFSAGFAPLSLSLPAWAVLAAALALAARQAAPRRAALVMLAFGFAWFASSLSWTATSMTEHGHLPAALAAAGVAALALVCALFPAAAAWAAAKLIPAEGSSAAGAPWRALAAACGIAAAEYLRGAGGADFGWSTPALALLELPTAGYAPLGGGHLVNLAGLLSAGLAAACGFWAAGRRFGPALAAALAAAALWAGGAALSAASWSEPGPALAVRLVQADLPVVDGFTRADPAVRLRSALPLAAAPWPAEADAAAAKILLAPEGLMSGALSAMRPDARAALGELLDAAGVPVLFNAFRHPAPNDWRNTAFLLQDGRVAAYTDKRKLVPFGEYVPAGFRWFVDLLGVPLADLTPGLAVQPNLALGPMRAGVLICYENLDGEVLQSLWRDPAGGPDTLLVTANLGWFSPRVIPQHLDMTRLRAMESARPAASVNMNGLSAVVNAKGEVAAAAPASGRASLDAVFLTARGEPTPYLRAGDRPAAALAAALFVLFALLARRARRRASRA